MSSSEIWADLSEDEVEDMLKGGSEPETSFSAASRTPLYHDAYVTPKSLPPRGSISALFHNVAIDQASQTGRSGSRTATTTASANETSAPTVVSTSLPPSVSTPHSNPGVSSIGSSTDRRLCVVAPAVAAEMGRNTADPVDLLDFVDALQSLAKVTDYITTEDNAKRLKDDEERLNSLLQSPSKDVTSKLDKYMQSSSRAETLQYKPFSELCNAICKVVSPGAFEGSDTAGVLAMNTRRNDPKRLVCSLDNASRCPDVITVPEEINLANLLMTNVNMLWEFKLVISAAEKSIAETFQQSESGETSQTSNLRTSRLRSQSSKPKKGSSQPTGDPSRSTMTKVSQIGVQLGTYVTEAFSSGPLRSHLICGTVQDGWMSLWWFDRAGVIRTKPVHLAAPSGLEHLTRLFYHLTRLGRRGWGFVWRPGFVRSPSHLQPRKETASHPHDLRLTKRTERPSFDSTSAPDDSLAIDNSMLYDPDVKAKDRDENTKHDEEVAKFKLTNSLYGRSIIVNDRRIHIRRTVYRQYGLFSRGVYVVEGKMEPKAGEGTELIDVVVKFSWQLLELAQEYELAKRARDAVDEEIRPCVPLIFGQETWYSTHSKFRRKLMGDFPGVKHRQLSVLVAERLERLATVDNAKDLKQVVVDIARCHRSLMRHAGILHRDISFENIMVRRRDGEVRGVLNDFDLVLDLCKLKPDQNPDRLQITGTRLFMACDLLDPEIKVKKHTGRHDMESLFWVVIWFIYRCQDGKECELGPNGKRPLDDWLTSELCLKKIKFLGNGGLGLDVPFIWREAWKTWVRKLVRFHRDARQSRIDLFNEINDLTNAGSMTPTERKGLMARMEALEMRDDSTAWTKFLEIVEGTPSKDYPLKEGIPDYDPISALELP